MNAHLYFLQSLYRATNVFKRAFVGHSLSLTSYSSQENLENHFHSENFYSTVRLQNIIIIMVVVLRLVTYENHWLYMNQAFWDPQIVFSVLDCFHVKTIFLFSSQKVKQTFDIQLRLLKSLILILFKISTLIPKYFRENQVMPLFISSTFWMHKENTGVEGQ